MTPAYQGANQPPADSGGNLLGRVGTFFGTVTPMYASAPVMKAPDPMVVQKDASTATPCAYSFDPPYPIDPAAIAAGQIAIVIPRSLISAIDPAALADGKIAIVVPRNLGCGDADPSGT